MPLEKNNNTESTEITKVKREYDKSENIVNIYAEGGFFRCKEFSAVVVSAIMGYKLYLNICKKNNFIFLECGFPAMSAFEVKKLLKDLGYNYRIYGGNKKVDEVLEELLDGKTMVDKDIEKVRNTKQGLFSLELPEFIEAKS